MALWCPGHGPVGGCVRLRVPIREQDSGGLGCEEASVPKAQQWTAAMSSSEEAQGSLGGGEGRGWTDGQMEWAQREGAEQVGTEAEAKVAAVSSP